MGPKKGTSMLVRVAKLLRLRINDDSGLTMAYLTARSNLVWYGFVPGKLLQSTFNGKNLQVKTQ